LGKALIPHHIARTLDPAREAFRLAVDKFGADLTKDARKRDRVNQALRITELQTVVTEAQAKYATKHEDSGTRKWLVRLFKKISHYGAILDVLVQHHPEYVALAWGAMKFLFTVSWAPTIHTIIAWTHGLI
jgi:hypothetical protein